MGNENNDYLKNFVISALHEIFSEKKCSDVYLNDKEVWNQLMKYCRDIWTLNMNQKDKLYTSIVMILSYEDDLSKWSQYLSELNTAFCRPFPKSVMSIYPPVPNEYKCLKCEKVGEHWAMECMDNIPYCFKTKKDSYESLK